MYFILCENLIKGMGVPIYLMRKRAMGDVLWMEPLIRQLAATHTNVIVSTKNKDLFAHYPLPNVRFADKLNFLEKLLFRLRAPRFINLEGAYEKRPRMHLLHAYQEEAGLPLTNEYPRLYLSEAEKKMYAAETPYVVLSLDSASSRNYRKVYGVDWAQVVTFLQSRGIRVIYAGIKAPGIPGVIHYKTSVRELVALIYNCALFIGVDSAPSHIAASLHKPSLLFFGAVNPDFRHFRDIFNGIIMQQPCEYAGCYHESANTIDGTVCRLVGDEGIPKCSVHSTAEVIVNIQKLLSSYDFESS